MNERTWRDAEQEYIKAEAIARVHGWEILDEPYTQADEDDYVRLLDVIGTIRTLESEVERLQAAIDAVPEWVASPAEATDEFIIWCPFCGDERHEQIGHTEGCIKKDRGMSERERGIIDPRIEDIKKLARSPEYAAWMADEAERRNDHAEGCPKGGDNAIDPDSGL